MGHNPIKLSSPATKEFWEIPVLHEDADLLALAKPARLLVSPDRYDPERPNLMKLLHRDIERGAVWARERAITYLANVHRLDFETTGVLLLAKNKPALSRLAAEFGGQRPGKEYLALAHGCPTAPQFTVEARIAPHPSKPGLMRVEPKGGKRAITRFVVAEQFDNFVLLRCHPLTGRTHQIRVHLRSVRLPLVADTLYGGQALRLSSLKPNYRFKRDREELPLIGRVALHAAELSIAHPDPAHAGPVVISAPWPKDLLVAVKYLRRYKGMAQPVPV